MNSKIWLSSPHMGGKEKDFVNNAFDTNWVAPLGPNVNGFEEDIQNYTGCAYATCLSSGTAAIHLALIMLGIEPGDEVICQTFTFSATVNPIRYLGATPVFIDSEPETWNMCPDLLLKAIKDRISKGKKPKAIIPVHLYGMPAKMLEILEIANHYNIPVIEDAAESLGSSINNKLLGTFGTFGVLSFNGNKIITTSGGGALLSKDQIYNDQAKFLATQARDNATHYQHSQIGYNYRMSNICAGIGRGQMLVIDQRVMERRRNYDTYRNKLKQINQITFLKEPEGFKSNRWLTTIIIDPANNNFNNEELRLMMEKENIECRHLWKPMHLQPVFKHHPAYLNGLSEKLFCSGLCLPSGSNLTDTDLSRIITIIHDYFKK